MARIEPLDENNAPQGSVEIATAHELSGSRMTNMKWTLAHSPVALKALLEWYPLYDEVVPFLGERRTTLFCHAISTQNDCLICSTFFRRILIDWGEDPDALATDELDELIMAFGRQLAIDAHGVGDDLWEPLAALFDEAQLVALT